MNTLIDEVLADFFKPPKLPGGKVKIIYKEIDPKYYATLKSELLKAILDVVGGDLPITQPLDNELDPVQYEGHRIFRKGANWQKEELRTKFKAFFGENKEG